MARSVRITSRTADFLVATETTCFNAPLADKIFVTGYLLKSPEKRKKTSFPYVASTWNITSIMWSTLFCLNLDKGAI